MKIFIFIFLLMSWSFCQSKWEWLSPYPQGNDFISAVSKNGMAWFLGEANTLIMSPDGGNSWINYSPVVLPVNHSSFGIYPKQFITIGGNYRIYSLGGSRIYQSDDTAKTWTISNLPTDNIFFTSDKYGFNGWNPPLRTTDGGKTWVRFTDPYPPNIGGISFIWGIDTLVWVYGYEDRLALSTDGGNSWSRLGKPINKFPDSTYSMLYLNINQYGIGFLSGYAMSNSDYRRQPFILRTEDFGYHWKRQNTDYAYSSILNISEHTWLLIGNNMWGVYGLCYEPSILKSVDDGKSWYETYNLSPYYPAPTVAVWIPEFETVIAGGYYGCMIRSKDYGESWELIYKYKNRTLHEINFNYVPELKTTVGYAVGDYGTILRSLDRGKNWETKSINLDYGFYLTQVKGYKNHVWAAGSHTTLLHSIDFGANWQRVSTPFDQPINGQYLDYYVFNSLDVYNEQYIAGTVTLPNYYAIKTYCIYSEDGGKSWKLFSLPRGKMLNAVKIVKPGHLILGGDNWLVFTDVSGFLRTTTDGGATWDSLHTLYGVNSIAMTNCTEGIALGYRHNYLTRDGGKTWIATKAKKWNTHVKNFAENPNLLACMAEFNIYTSDNNGLNWKLLVDNIPVNLDYHSFAIIDGEENTFLITERHGFVRKIKDTPVNFVPADSCKPDTTKEDSLITNFEPYPDKFFLFGNYPNPFNDKTVIKYQLPEQLPVTIEIYNSKGQLVLVSKTEEQDKGVHFWTWDSKDKKDKYVSSGVYFYFVKAGTLKARGKMVLIR
ncbi:MAG: T9SS type A sorting domain-containing protein [Calditrichaeota bacterium]|nr:T9SS type A sorting domain-containing protein [Calditrichota bacterium]